ncbi:helix-turn-helix transcriptional regulator [Aurantivibrio infirmus]
MYSLPEVGFLRLRQIIGDSKSNPPIPPIIPISRSLWWDWVKTGKAPKPHRPSPNVTMWKASDIQALADEITSDNQAA